MPLATAFLAGMQLYWCHTMWSAAVNVSKASAKVGSALMERHVLEFQEGDYKRLNKLAGNRLGPRRGDILQPLVVLAVRCDGVYRGAHSC